MDLFSLDLGEFGAPGFELRDRLDMSGHERGAVDPHINSEVIRSDSGQLQIRDLSANQVDGFNGMQFGGSD